MKARCGLTFILSPTEKTSASTTDDSQEDFSESRPVSVPVRRASRHSFPKPLLSHTIKHYNSMSARSGSGGSTGHNDDDWKNIANEKERRKVQNRNAQRRHRSKKRYEEEEKTRIADNQYVAGSSYKTPGPEDLGNEDPTGLPWGSVSLRPVFEGGKGKEKQSQYSSREGSSAPSKTSSSRGLWHPYAYPSLPSAHLGLQLPQRWATRQPALDMMPRGRRSSPKARSESDPGLGDRDNEHEEQNDEG
ncbi:hypothetical protein MMC10_010113 [Thelotrema lepadinum]|nr:hypothetical protein [Thelotrema lepadinum]